MPEATHIKAANKFEYATAADFCRIFSEDIPGLFLLALLLTGDDDKAEQCFVAALENATNRRTVFKEWARPWSRRAIIQSALDMINPRPRHANAAPISPAVANSRELSREREIAAVLRLETFERFVFVMSVLERHSYHTCAILLGTTRRDVIEARSRALEQLGRAVESRTSTRVHAGLAPLADERPALDVRMFARSA